jgi:hypothetical protein
MDRGCYGVAGPASASGPPVGWQSPEIVYGINNLQLSCLNPATVAVQESHLADLATIGIRQWAELHGTQSGKFFWVW